MAKENALEKQRKEVESSFANAPLKKKISFFSAIIMVIGSVMGAGMFFKAGNVLNASQGSILFSVFSWLLTIIAIVLMALALIEIASARNDNLSMIGWCQTFNSRIVYKACKNFMSYLYVPLSYFFLPLYFVQSIQDGVAAVSSSGNAYIGSQNIDWLLIMLITLGVSIYFIVVCGLSSRIANIQNYIITTLNFIPVFIVIIMCIIGAARIGGVAGGAAGVANSSLTGVTSITYDPVNFIPTSSSGASLYTFRTLTPGFGLFLGISAIFFAYDGFYVTAGLQSEMKEPKKTPYALLYGLVAITFVYLTVAVVMSVGSTNGSPSGTLWIFKMTNTVWLYAIFQILIGVGVLSILNAFGAWSPRFFEDLMKNNELPFSAKYANKLNSNKPIVGVLYNLVLAIPTIIIFCLIGCFGYVNNVGYDSYLSQGVINHFGRLYSFADLMATWASVGAFTFILFAIIGALRNRKLGEVYTEKSKLLQPSAIGCGLIMGPAIFFNYFEPVADLFFLFRISPSTDGYVTEYLVPRIMLVVVLFIYLGVTILPTTFEDLYLTRKYGSVMNGEAAKFKAFAKATNVPLEEAILNQLKTTKRCKLNSWEQAELKRDHLTEKEIQHIIANEY